MGRFIKSGRVVIVTAGKYAGRKAVVVKETNEGTQDRLYCKSYKIKSNLKTLISTDLDLVDFQ